MQSLFLYLISKQPLEMSKKDNIIMTFKNTVRITLIISILTMLSGCYSFSSLKNTPQRKLTRRELTPK